jgi:bacterioferritin-associated ferredoxin
MKMILIFIFVGHILSLVLVCHCKGISDRELERAIDAGACSRGEVTLRCGAASVCGGCGPVIDEFLEARRVEAVPVPSDLAFAAS